MYGNSQAGKYLSDLLIKTPKEKSKVDRLFQVYNTKIRQIKDSSLPKEMKEWALKKLMMESTQHMNKFNSPISTISQNVMKSTYRTCLKTL